MRSTTRRARALPALLLLASGPSAQSNKVPGLDVMLSELRDLTVHGRSGSFPNGVNGTALRTTVCNTGSVEVPWRAPMDVRHPMIAFLVAREADGRMVQISDRSYVKHGFAATNGNKCSPCMPPLGQLGEDLGLGCSDTYTTGTNADRFYLGPPEEIDPWLGAWSRLCSHFDRGEPSVAPPFDCDGMRSFTQAQANALGPEAHRVVLADADLLTPGARFIGQAQYVVAGEAERRRDDNLGTRRFVPTWDGNGWTFDEAGGFVHGSVLERWSGATVRSTTNGSDDGRVYVGVAVTGPVDGWYRYEYALHNRDAARGVGAFEVPWCPQARLRRIGFRDVDGDPANDWSVSLEEDRIRFATSANPLEWNALYNFWFESTAEPAPAPLVMEAFRAGAGAPSTSVRGASPTGIHTVVLGSDCAGARAPELELRGDPARPRLGNASFELVVGGLEPNAVSALFLRPVRGAPIPCGEALASGARWVSGVRADAAGQAVHALPIPEEAFLEGLELEVQTLSATPGSATAPTSSPVLRLIVGSGSLECP